jgi:hypothetical protein
LCNLTQRKEFVLIIICVFLERRGQETGYLLHSYALLRLFNWVSQVTQVFCSGYPLRLLVWLNQVTSGIFLRLHRYVPQVTPISCAYYSDMVPKVLNMFLRLIRYVTQDATQVTHMLFRYITHIRYSGYSYVVQIYYSYPLLRLLRLIRSVAQVSMLCFSGCYKDQSDLIRYVTQVTQICD